ncbi:MAG: hypothetical protein ACLSUW_01465 [Akkermansia sp.]
MKAINSLVINWRNAACPNPSRFTAPQLPIENPANNPEESDEADQAPWTPCRWKSPSREIGEAS